MSPPDAALSSLRAVAEALDGLGLAVYVLDEDDRSVLWNRTFLHFFPEHADRIHAGEPYRENLRRFYDVRLRGAERASLERFVEEGIARNRAQTRPFSFEHHGRRLHAASLPMPGIGRLRTWRAEEPGAQFAAPPVVAGVADGLDEHHGTLLDHLPVGLMVTNADLRIQWVNEPFVELYRLPSRTVALGSTLAGVYGTAWEGEAPAERAAFESGLGRQPALTAYVFRHALVTDMRSNGWPPEEIALVLGETDAATVNQWYGLKVRGSLAPKATVAIEPGTVKAARDVRPIDRRHLEVLLRAKVHRAGPRP